MNRSSIPAETSEAPEVPVPRLGSLIVLGKNIEIPARKLHTVSETDGKGRIVYSDATEMNARAAGVFLRHHIKQHGYCPLTIFSTGPTSGNGYDSEADTLQYVLLRDFPDLKDYQADRFFLERTSRNTPDNAAEVRKQYGDWIANLKPTGLITTSYHIDRAAEEFKNVGIEVTKLIAEQTVVLDTMMTQYASDFTMNLQGVIEGTFSALSKVPGVRMLTTRYSDRSRR